MKRFPCLRLAYEALRAGQSAPVYLNAANEVAVDRFLKRQITFNAIAAIVERVLQQLPAVPVESIDQILTADRSARAAAEHVSNRLGRTDLSALQGSQH